MQEPLFPRPVLIGAVLTAAVILLTLALVACEAGRPTPDIEVRARVYLPAVPIGRTLPKAGPAPASYPEPSEIPAPTSAYP